MRVDQTVERIRKIRHEISEQCEHDSKRLIEYYIKYQAKYRDRLVDRSSNCRIVSITVPN